MKEEIKPILEMYCGFDLKDLKFISLFAEYSNKVEIKTAFEPKKTYYIEIEPVIDPRLTKISKFNYYIWVNIRKAEYIKVNYQNFIAFLNNWTNIRIEKIELNKQIA